MAVSESESESESELAEPCTTSSVLQLNIRTLEHSQTLSTLFQLATEVALEDCCQQKDNTSPRGSGVSNSCLYVQSSYGLNLETQLALVKI